MTLLRRPIHAGFTPLVLSLPLIALTFVAGCSHRPAHVNTPLAPARIGTTETGVASWYGFPYHGRRAASGEVYDMQQFTAAHRTLPFQTWVEVTNLSNGKQVDVRINDRGPFVKGRIVDLSQAAARDIDMLRAGTARVRLKVIPPPPSANLPLPRSAPPVDSKPALVQPVDCCAVKGYVVQAGAFADPGRAEALRAALEDHFVHAHIDFTGGTNGVLIVWRVIVGYAMTRDQAAELAIRVRQETGAALVVAEPEPDPLSSPQ
ncbi:MAG: septal ring lytic transglycosylase RlpA family protein [Acidobacteriota bacterium]|nr:septal ring lytic transglycosylase RlpA family protein [Acidobacteriota bacterium]MDP9112949.1 septal ring lytic transglycosylase RlpA family protein [Acidobacteriota bacterium]